MKARLINQGGYFPHYQVERLATEILHWVPLVDEVECWVDQDANLYNARSVTVRTIPQHPALRGWWAKLWLFKEIQYEPMIYFDLDIIVRDRVELPKPEWDRIWAPRDYLAEYQPQRSIDYINSSIMLLWGDYQEIWEVYEQNWQEYQRQYRGDQEFLWGVFKHRFLYLDQELSESYKWRVRTQQRSTRPIIVFHGPDAKGAL
ncbi:glycosyltransferase [Phage DSL-LC06]|nr:glycosyltransferase [Phage DSL-LC06]